MVNKKRSNRKNSKHKHSKNNHSKNKHIKKIGSRRQVMNGHALKTSGGLTKKQLKYNKHNRIVSKKQSARAKREKRLVKAGYHTKKGEFGAVFKDPNSKK